MVSMLADEHQKLDTTTFANDMTTFKRKDDVLTLLVHLGYLGYDEQAELAFIPNEEIRRQYVSALLVGISYDEKTKRHEACIERM